MTTKDTKNMSKKLFLISSYCDDSQKIQVLKDNLITLNNLNVDTLLLSPISLPQEVINLSTFYFQTKENPVTSISEKTYIFWSKPCDEIKLERFYPDYGWADLYQRKKLSELAITFDYDLYYHIIYDTKISYDLIQEIHNDKEGYYYSNRATTGNINEVSLHFLPLKKTQLKSFKDYINKKDYVTSHDLVHQYLLKWFKDNNFKKSEVIVDEYINYYGGEDIFSLSQNTEVKIFFEKDELNNTTNKFVIYGTKDEKVTIIINETETFENVRLLDVTDSRYLTNEIEKIEMVLKGKKEDLTKNYNKIGRNKII